MPKTNKNVPIHLPSNQSVERGQLGRKRLGKEKTKTELTENKMLLHKKIACIEMACAKLFYEETTETILVINKKGNI